MTTHTPSPAALPEPQGPEGDQVPHSPQQQQSQFTLDGLTRLLDPLRGRATPFSWATFREAGDVN